MSEQRAPGVATALVAMAALVAVSAVVGGGWVREVADAVRDDWNADRTPVTPADPIVVTVGNTDPYGLTINDCGQEGAFFPCVEQTGTAWVIRWSPSRAVDLTPCAQEDGGPVLPCVWPDPDTGSGEWIVYTDHVEVTR